MALTAATFIACAFMAIKFMSTGESALSIALWYHTASVIVGAVPLAVSSFSLSLTSTRCSMPCTGTYCKEADALDCCLSVGSWHGVLDAA